MTHGFARGVQLVNEFVAYGILNVLLPILSFNLLQSMPIHFLINFTHNCVTAKMVIA